MTSKSIQTKAKHRVLIAGCGKLGIAFARHVQAQTDAADWALWGLRRNVDKLPQTIHPWPADLLRPETLQPPVDFTHVIYTATPPKYDEEHYLATYRDGLQNVLTAIQRQNQPPKRWLLVSSTSVYAQDDGRWVDEDSSADATHFAGAAILAGEQLLKASGNPHTIVRFGGIYGPSRTQALLDRVEAQKISLSIGPTQYTNRIHEDDCAGIIYHLLTSQDVEPLYIGVDGQGAPRNEVMTWMAHQLGLPTPPTPETPPVRSSRRPFTNKRCRNQRLLDSGYSFLYQDYKAGYHDILAARRDTKH